MLHTHTLPSPFSPFTGLRKWRGARGWTDLALHQRCCRNSPLGPGSLADEMQDGELHSIFLFLVSFSNAMNVHQRTATPLVFNSPSALTNISYHSLLVLAQKWHRPKDLWQNKFKSLSQELQVKVGAASLHHGSRQKEALHNTLGHSTSSVVSVLSFFWTEPKPPNTTSSPPCLYKMRWGLFTLEFLRHCWVLSYRWELFPSSPQPLLVLCRQGSRHLSWSSVFCALTPVMLSSWNLAQPLHSACSFTLFQPAKPFLEQL